ncbi:galactose-3-O-sulfotransferase 3 [Elysia marginata]|uniref:Galactose-3-O-sulfotransferase 3 n=1 Tax=Elysia marginata TaxID=1093978 RepID=A0AAV4F4J1_9GAST|nr:galactose-3-O-sulfotransferase 3 [Elysia marginata]
MSKTLVTALAKFRLVGIFALSFLVILGIFLSGISFPIEDKRYTDPNEIQQVVFAKIHKAASSTIQNVLLRFAVSRGLDVLLPKQKNHINEFESKIDPDALIWHPKGKLFDILSNHLIFDEDEISAYLPRSAFRFGILREPLSQTLSALRFYASLYLDPKSKLSTAMQMYFNDPVRGFLDHPEEFCDEDWSTDHCFIDNRMSMDLGFNSSDMYASKRNKTKVDEFVRQISRQFDLMLLFEYFDESMILLRRYMHWQIRDIIYLKVNASPYRSPYVWNRNPTLTHNQTKIFREWAAVDIALYNHFLSEFFEKIKKEDFFEEEVLAYKEILSTVSNFCANPGILGPYRLQIPCSRWTEEFHISLTDCAVMKFSEDELVDLVRTQQLNRLQKNLWYQLTNS